MISQLLRRLLQDLTDRERLTLHAEVKALQARLGISYKDAAHRLYMAEVEKLNVNKRAHKALSTLRSHVELSLKGEDMCPPKGDRQEVDAAEETNQE